MDLLSGNYMCWNIQASDGITYTTLLNAVPLGQTCDVTYGKVIDVQTKHGAMYTVAFYGYETKYVYLFTVYASVYLPYVCFYLYSSDCALP